MKKTLPNTLRLMLVADQKSAQPRDFLELIAEAFLGGVSCLQLREKYLSGHDFYNLALKVKSVCQKHNKPLFINDRLDIALAVNADGLHIGQSDLPFKVARKLFPNKIIGVSASNFQDAEKAYLEGADYLGVGAIFPTLSKADARPLSKEEVLKIVKLPILKVAIGGITIENAASVWALGVDGLAVISAITAAENPKLAAEILLANMCL